MVINKFLGYIFNILKSNKEEITSYYVQESINSTWFYHITKDGKSLCGTTYVLDKKLPMKNWKIRSSHIHERYCEKCDRLYSEKT